MRVGVDPKVWCVGVALFVAAACSGRAEQKADAPRAEPKPPVTVRASAEPSPGTSAAAPPPSGTADVVKIGAPPAWQRERDEIFASMVSVAYHAKYGPQTAEERRVLEIPTLLDAAELLGRSKDASARAFAFTTLYSMQPRDAQRLGADWSKALEKIDAPFKKKLDQKFDNPLGNKEVDARKLSLFVDDAMGVKKSTCGASKPSSKSWVDDQNIIHVETTLTVPVKVDPLRAVVDPQNWDCCGKKYFSQACVPEYDAAGNVVTTDGVTPKCKASGLPAPGSKWKQPLYERFRVGVVGFDVLYFQTIINIDVAKQQGDPEHGLTFSLKESRGGYIGPFKGKCDFDSGTVTVMPKPNGKFEVKATKELRLVFDSAIVTKIMTKLTAATMPIAGDSLEESICCAAGECKHP